MSLTLTATTRAVTADLRNDAASQPRLDSSSSYLSNGVRPMAVRELHESPALETQEPPRKKVRLSDQTWKSAEDIPPWVNATLEACLDEQVFPHIDGEIAKLPRDKVNTRMLATEVIGALTGDDFTAEFKRLNGRISAEFEKNLALRARKLVSNWSKLPGFQQRPFAASTPLRRAGTEQIPSENGVPPQPLPQLSQTRRQFLANPVISAPRAIANGKTISNRPTSPIVISSSSPSPEPPDKNDSLTATSQIVNTVHTEPNPLPFVRPRSAKPEPLVGELDGPLDRQSQAEKLPSASPPRTPPPVLRNRKPWPQHDATSPKNYRSRAHALAWREDVHGGNKSLQKGIQESERPRWFALDRRPYISGSERRGICQGARQFIRLDPSTLREPFLFHVDFTAEEVQCLLDAATKALGLPPRVGKREAEKTLLRLVKIGGPAALRNFFAQLEGETLVKGRTQADVEAFLADLSNRDVSREPGILSLERDDYDRQGALVRSSRVHSLLLAREVAGNRGYGSMRCLHQFTNEFKNCREDSLELRAEWTNCAGDIATITWVSNDGFICGTTEHSDSHNQQYNKPGNLVLGSCSQGTLRAYPDHRIVRPIVEKGENATDAMRQSQDPWLYASVVSSDYDPVHDRAFTSGFDRTVKIWRADKSGASMSLLGTWFHGGNVNFVVSSKHESGMVATAADVPAAAVRIYHINEEDISRSAFRSYSCSRVVDLEGNVVPTDKWAYFPATIHWGLSADVRHLLLVGYSPRSLTGDDNDIPEDRRDSGEICLWDGLTGERWRVMTASTQNVFEVLWHPSQPSFIAATSPQGLELEENVRTQIRVFRISDNVEFGGKAFTAVQTLDCTAADINELAIRPNSFTFCYISAGCTDGNTYLWDTARGDKPIHILRHGDPLEEFSGDREKEDTGVKFIAWGNTPDRFYTGSSDGVVKVWNVRSGRRPLVRDILEVPAPVSYGMFSPDRSKLIIGDASGRVFLLSIDEEDQKPAAITNVQLPGTQMSKNTRRPKLVIPHPEPEPPKVDAEGRPLEPETGRGRAGVYLRKGQLVLHRNPTVGAVQGPNYAETGLFRREAHGDDDPSKPLLARIDLQQQESVKMFRPRRRDMSLRGLKDPARAESLHAENIRSDLEISSLPEETRLELEMSRVDLDDVGVPYDLAFEESMDELEI